MPNVKITLNDGATKTVSFDDGFTDADIEEVANQLNANIKPEKKGIDLTPSGLAKGAVRGIAALGTTPFVMAKQNIPFGEAYKNELSEFEKAEKSLESPLGKASDFLFDTYVYSKLPYLKVTKGAGLLPNIANMGATGAYQGAITGGLESLKQQGDLSGIGTGAGIGASVGGGLPVVGKVAQGAVRILPSTGGFFAKTVGRLKPETLAQAVKPESQALDLTEAQAQNLLMDTTERVRDTYKKMLSEAGQNVGDVANSLKNVGDRVNVNDLKGDITRTFNKYQGDSVNPARNMTGGLETDLLTLIDNAGAQKKINATPTKPQNAELLAEQELLKEYNRFKKALIKKYGSIDELKRLTKKDIKQNALYGERFDSLDDYRELLAYEQLLQNAKFVDNKIPSSVNGEFIGSGNIGAIPEQVATENVPFTISPIDLQKIKEQVGHMINWSDEAAKNYQNPILEQIYGKFNNRLSNLAPELAEANKEYAKLAKFKKNEGLNRILKATDNIDSASTALKNYNSTVTKGNTNRNIQDLEEVFVKAGEKPFLKDIDDVNAAMDLNNARTTGDSWLANIATQATRPALKFVRELNRKGIPIILDKTGQAIQRILPANIARTAPILYGGVEHNEYR